LDVCIGSLGIVFGGISISCDIRIEINVNILVWMFRYPVPRIDILFECQILFGCSSDAIHLYGVLQQKLVEK
jgi:hypothetical protein